MVLDNFQVNLSINKNFRYFPLWKAFHNGKLARLDLLIIDRIGFIRKKAEYADDVIIKNLSTYSPKKKPA